MMMTVGCLYFLLLSDTAFSGICAASGRDARIKKLGYYLRSMWDGALWGHAFVVLGVIILSVAVRSATDPQRALDDLVVMGQRFNQFAVSMQPWYLPPSLFEPFHQWTCGLRQVRWHLAR